MNTAVKDIKKLAKKGIDEADETTVKMVLAMLQVKREETGMDDADLAEINRRFEEYESGKVAAISFEELERRVFGERKKKLRATQ